MPFAIATDQGILKLHLVDKILQLHLVDKSVNKSRLTNNRHKNQEQWELIVLLLSSGGNDQIRIPKNLFMQYLAIIFFCVCSENSFQTKEDLDQEQSRIEALEAQIQDLNSQIRIYESQPGKNE